MVDFQSWYRMFPFGYSPVEIRLGVKNLSELKHLAGRQLFPSRANRPVHCCRPDEIKKMSMSYDWEIQLLARQLRATEIELIKLNSASQNRVGPQEERPRRVEPLLLVMATLGTGRGEVQYPRGLTSSPSCQIYLADSMNHRIQTYNQCGIYIRSFGSYGSLPGEFKEPCDVAVFPNEDVAVADRHNCRIQVFTHKGEYKYNFQTMYEPFSVAVDDSFNIIVSTMKRTVEIYRRSGKGVGYFPLPGHKKNEICLPVQVCVNSKYEILVSDPTDQYIRIYSYLGEKLYQFQPTPCGDTLVMKPWGISLDSKENIVVADALNHTVNLYTDRGIYLRRIVGPCDGVGTVSAVCVGKEGHLLVSEFSVTGPHSVKMFRFEHCRCHVDRPPSAKRKPTPSPADEP